MVALHPKSNWLNALAVCLLTPSVYFIVSSVLKYEFGIHGPFDSIYPFLESTGIKEDFGFNINLLILFGPVLALALAAWQVIRIELFNAKEEFHATITVRKIKFPLFIIFLSGLVLATLAIYLLVENLTI